MDYGIYQMNTKVSVEERALQMQEMKEYLVQKAIAHNRKHHIHFRGEPDYYARLERGYEIDILTGEIVA